VAWVEGARGALSGWLPVDVQCEFPTELDEREQRARDLVRRYHILCELYDATVCSVRRDGVAWPATPQELYLVNHNARSLTRQLGVVWSDPLVRDVNRSYLGSALCAADLAAAAAGRDASI
jgi:hypothetical protein